MTAPVSDYSEAIRLDPKDTTTYRLRGATYVTKKDYDRALADLNEALRQSPGNAVALCNRGLAYQGKQEYDKALADFNAALRIDPDWMSATRATAWLLATCPKDSVRDGNRAVECAVRACDLTYWGDPAALSTLAAARAERGQFDDAVNWQTKALANPQYVQEHAVDGPAMLKQFQDHKPWRQK